ncbi:hypothetical protein Sste5346_004791 [Sporothrix stenoceras]|uniref:LysM domain-containing protein n=1 Tax=Sporothrix stenoceras TaxID=5173 RepID=A0ABR3Z7A4_9PEZI
MKLLLLPLSSVGLVAARSTTTPPPGLTYLGTYTIQANDTLASISVSVGRGVCALARANRMADVELMPRVGMEMLVPANDSIVNDTSCLLKEPTSTLPCIYGGPHVYTVVAGDTLAKVAKKLNLDVSALGNSTGPPPPGASSSSSPSVSVDTPLQVGRGLKIPQCSPSACQVQPYRFVYGTYVDLAASFNTTVGQILAFNPTYSFSAATDVDKAPVITLPNNCRPLSTNITVIS